ncbi:hypothetical protein EI94DRAFT_1740809 [Lactarius quietus]|nr:hypothetical protein EI94DRAFT_1740809 [Lactarius quietus]
MIAPHIPFLLPIAYYHIIRGAPLGHIPLAIIAAVLGRSKVVIVLGSSFTVIAATISPDSDPHWHMQPFVFLTPVRCSSSLNPSAAIWRTLPKIRPARPSGTDLMVLAPSMAIIYTDATCTQKKKVPTELLQIGDIVKPGRSRLTRSQQTQLLCGALYVSTRVRLSVNLSQSSSKLVMPLSVERSTALAHSTWW